MKYLITSLVLICSLNSYAQKTIEIFKNELPDTLLNSPELFIQVSHVIDSYSRLNPKILGYYFNYLDKWLGNGITSSDSNDYNILINFVNEQIQKRNVWLDSTIRIVDEIIPLSIKASKIISYLESDEFVYKKHPPVKALDRGDKKNYDNYCFYKYLSMDSSLIFEAQKNYAEMIPVASESLIKFYSEVYKSADQISVSERYDNIEKCLRHFWLFKDSYTIEENKKTQFLLYDFIEKLIAEEYMSHNQLGGFLGATFLKANIVNEFIFNEQISDQASIYFSGKTNIVIQNNLYAGVRYKLTLGEYKSLFTHLDFRLGIGFANRYSSSTSLPETTEGEYILRPDSGIVAHLVKAKFSNNSFEDFSAFLVFFQVTSPFFYISQRLYLEAGLEYILMYANHTITVRRDDEYYSQIGADPSKLIHYVKQFDIKSTEHLFKPIFGIGYHLSESFSLNIKFVPYEVLTEISYTF